MPHQCTNCGRGFPDGSKEMLSGCPDCGGNKFQFSPAGSGSDRGSSSADSTPSAPWSDGSAPTGSGADDASRDDREFAPWPDTARPPEERAESPPPSRSTGDDSTGTGGFVERSAARATGTSVDDDSVPTRRDDAMEDDFEWVEGDEDDAQADARSDVVSPEELPPSTAAADADGQTVDGSTAESEADEPPTHGRVVSEPDAERPSLEDLRDELNDQFESIKIVSPGQYELNLMELYDREEHIVSLQEDGRYVINVPDSWRDADDE